jgi:hypothetical protein
MSGGIAVSAPTDPVQAFMAELANMRSRIADLERSAGRRRAAEFGPGAMNTAGVTSGVVQSLVCALTVPDQGCAGVLKIWGHLMVAGSTGSDTFEILLKNGTSDVAIDRLVVPVAGATITGNPVGRIAMTAGSGVTVNLLVGRNAGTGTASYFADNRFNRIEAIFVPT